MTTLRHHFNCNRWGAQLHSEQFKLPVPAGLHTLFGLAEKVSFAGETLAALLPNTSLTGNVAWFTFLPRLLLIVACWAFIHTGTICSNSHKHTHTVTQVCALANVLQNYEKQQDANQQTNLTHWVGDVPGCSSGTGFCLDLNTCGRICGKDGILRPGLRTAEANTCTLMECSNCCCPASDPLCSWCRSPSGVQSMWGMMHHSLETKDGSEILSPLHISKK